MFTRRFGISPGRWRKKNGEEAGNMIRQTTKPLWPAMGSRRLAMRQT
jgi:AraC-like DNA-binding protein